MKKIIYILIIFAVAFNSCKKTTKLIANFSFTGNVAQVPAEVHFTNESIDAINYTWDFGDASPTSNEKNPVHVYTKRNIYKVTLSASNSAGEFKQNIKDIDVGPIIHPPTITFTNGDSSIHSQFSNFTLSASFKADTFSSLEYILVTQQIDVTGSFTTFDWKKLSGASDTYKKIISIPFGVSQITYSFLLCDSLGKTSTKNYILYTSAPVGLWGKIDSNDGIMGNQYNTIGQFYSISNDSNYNIYTGSNYPTDIDFVYGHLSSDEAFIAAPSSIEANDIYKQNYPTILLWYLNKTLFKITTLTPSDFAKCTNDSLIICQTTKGVINTSYLNVKKNDVLAFVTQNGVKGLLWVKSVSGDYSTATPGSLVFAYKTTQ